MEEFQASIREKSLERERYVKNFWIDLKKKRKEMEEDIKKLRLKLKKGKRLEVKKKLQKGAAKVEPLSIKETLSLLPSPFIEISVRKKKVKKETKISTKFPNPKPKKDNLPKRPIKTQTEEEFLRTIKNVV